MTAEELAEQVDRVMERVAKPLIVTEARAALNEAGLLRARRDLEGALSILEGAQAQKRRCDAEERAAKDAHTQAVSEAEWELDGRFVVDGNKTYLVEGEDRRAMTADERTKWKALEATKQPAVAKALDALRQAEQASAEARDEVLLAERRFSACKADLHAAITTVETLRLALVIKEPA